MADIKQTPQPGEGKAFAALIGGGVMLLAISLLNLLSEISKPAKDFLTLDKAIGAYSGKILFGVLCGAIVWVALAVIFGKRKVNVMPSFIFFLAALGIATLFVFTPFLRLFIK